MAKHIVTAALPYANGSIHIGHLLEYIQADIYSRFLKLTGHDALYICASDMHGTPIEINAKKAGIPPEEFVEKYFKENQEDFKSFLSTLTITTKPILKKIGSSLNTFSKF